MNFVPEPSDSQLVFHLDLKKERTLGRYLNIVGTLIFILVMAIGYIILPFPYGADFSFIHVIGIVAGFLGYVVIHELVHALAMLMFSNKRLRFGVHGYFAYAGMPEAYFSKRQYVLIALAPSALLGAILISIAAIIATGNPLFGSWYWVTLIIMGQNFGGSIGDYYVVNRLAKFKAPVFINDDGMRMRFYKP